MVLGWFRDVLGCSGGDPDNCFPFFVSGKKENVPGLAGAATTADGDAIVALDLNALVASVAQDLSVVAVDAKRNEHMLVLVVDDSRTQRMVATSQFDTVGVETITAENGMVAIDLLNTTHRLPDVVLLDVEAQDLETIVDHLLRAIHASSTNHEILAEMKSDDAFLTEAKRALFMQINVPTYSCEFCSFRLSPSACDLSLSQTCRVNR